MSVDKWIEREITFQNKLNNLKIYYQSCTTITVTVLRGKDISVGFLHDLFDVPDVKVYVQCDAATGRNKFKTKAARNTTTPEWNESFTFILPDEIENATIQIDVYDEDSFKPDPHLGVDSFETNSLVLNEPKVFTLNMKQRGQVDIQLTKRWRSNPDCRMSLGLSESEKKFRIQRKPKTMKAIQRLLGKDRGPTSLEETPTVALAITGGGYRAMASCCGVMEAMEENDIKDTLMYITGLSGSAWYISTSYQQESMTDLGSLIKHHDWIRKRSGRSLYSFVWDVGFLMRYRDYRKFKIANHQNTTLVDIFGFSVGETFLDEKCPRSTLSSLKSYVETAEVPFPIMSCAHVHQNLPMSVFWDEVEMTPFEVSLPGYGINIPTEKFNSRWANGILQQELPEPPLHYMMGIGGSAFAILFDKITEQTEAMEEIQEYVDDVRENNSDDSQDKKEDESVKDEVDGAPAPKRRLKRGNSNFQSDDDQWLKEIHESSSSAYVPIEEQDLSLGRDFIIDRTAQVHNCASSFVKLQKFLFNTDPVDKEKATGRLRNTVSTGRNSMALCDSGIGCNLPAVHVLRPQRTVDVLIVVDCAPYASEGHLDMGSFATVQNQLSIHGIKIPQMSIDKIADDPFREVYLFEDDDDPDCPVVIWFTLANEHFKKLENPPRRPGYPKPDPVVIMVPSDMPEDQTCRIKGLLLISDSGEVKFNDFTITPDTSEYAASYLRSDALSFDRLRELIKYSISTNIWAAPVGYDWSTFASDNISVKDSASPGWSFVLTRNSRLVKEKIASKVDKLKKKK